jgi:hypothetical protein
MSGVRRITRGSHLKIAFKGMMNMGTQTLVSPGCVGTLSRLVDTLDPRRPQICDLARERLDLVNYPELRGLQIEDHEGCLVLRGRVSSYYLKQLAQESIRSISGVAEIRNVVEVVGTSR